MVLGESGLERRGLKRRHLIYYLRVFNRETGELIGHLVDVTRGGIMMINEKPVPIGEEYELRMALPEEIWGKNFLDFKGKSLWSTKDVNPDFYNTGFQISGLDGHEIDIIERLISEYGFRD
jgi:hypothetical protein